MAEDFTNKQKIPATPTIKFTGKSPDAVFMRCTYPSLSRQFEAQGIRVFNSAHVSEIANDKLRTAEFFSSQSLPMMPTYPLCITKNGLLDDFFPFPLIMKSRNGHGGTEVFLVENSAQIHDLLASTCTSPTHWIIQPVAKTLGRDVRVYVVGNQIVTAMERTSTTDFRSNYSLGGTARPYALSHAEEALILRVLANLQLDFAGIDLIFDGTRPILNELEDVVGCRMLYAHSDLDILETFLDHVQTFLESRR